VNHAFASDKTLKEGEVGPPAANTGKFTVGGVAEIIRILLANP